MLRALRKQNLPIDELVANLPAGVAEGRGSIDWATSSA